MDRKHDYVTLPDDLRELVGFVEQIARHTLAKGDEITPAILLAKRAAHAVFPLPLVPTSTAMKEASARLARETAAEIGADTAIVVMEAWMATTNRDDAYAQGKRSLAEHPDRRCMLALSVETPERTYMSFTPIDGAEGAPRTAGEIRFETFTGVDGTFTGLLPPAGTRQ